MVKRETGNDRGRDRRTGRHLTSLSTYKTLKAKRVMVRNDMKKRAHVWVSGRVQGVFFRATTRKEAQKRGVNGWVKNLSDGRVEAIFEGEEEKVKEMVDFCHEGSSSARVNEVEVEWEDYKDEFSDFGIRY